MEGVVWSSYIGGEIWRKLFGAVIIGEGYYKKWRGLFKALILAEIYYKGWIDLEEAIWSSYIRGEIWRELFGAFIIGEGSREVCLELL